MTDTRITPTVPTFIVPGARVSWDTWCGTATVTVMMVDRFRISYRCDDGVRDAWEATCFRELAENLPRGIRPAS